MSGRRCHRQGAASWAARWEELHCLHEQLSTELESIRQSQPKDAAADVLAFQLAEVSAEILRMGEAS